MMGLTKWIRLGKTGGLIGAHLLLAMSGRSYADCFPTPAGLIGWWPGDGSATNVLGTNHGALQGGATANTPGMVGPAFNFDGTNGYVQIPNSTILQPTNLTIECWVRFTSLDSVGTSPAGDQYIVFKQNTRSTDFEGFDLSKTRVSSSDYFRFLIASASGQTALIRSATAISTGMWYHVAAVRGSNFAQLYVNGGLERQTNVTFAQNYGNFPLYFGTSGQPSWDHKLRGSLDEVAIYNRALSSNEIAAIYSAGAAGKCKGPNSPVFPIVVWGDSSWNQTNVPGTLTNAMAIAAEGYGAENFNVGLKSDRTVSAWAFRDFNLTNLPPGLTNVLTVSAGIRHGLALKGDGSILGFGGNDFGQTTIPQGLGTLMSAVAGGLYSLALKNDGTVTGWGYSSSGEVTPPAGLSNVVAVAAGYFHSLAIKNDGTVVGWGLNWYGEADSPPGLTNVVAVSAGSHHSLALQSDGTVIAWGYNYNGQSTVPPGLSNVIAIAAGYYHSLALKRDGTVVAWGNNDAGQASPPAGLTNVVAIAAGNSHSLALLRNPTAQASPAIWWPLPADQITASSPTAILLPTVSGSLPISFQWYYNNAPLTEQTNRWLVLSDLQPNQTGNYKLVVANAYGSATSAVMTLTVPPPLGIALQPASQTVGHGGTVAFTASGNEAPATFQWQRNGTNVVNNARITGANSATLTISSAQISDVGDYRLVLSNAWGTTNSIAAHLTVLPLRAWGNNVFGQTNISPSLGDVVAATAGSWFNLAIHSNGTVTAWGLQSGVASGLFDVKSAVAGNNFSLAVNGDNTAVGWGANDNGQANPLGLTDVVAVSPGGYHGLALKRDGTIAGWGYNNSGQANPPPGSNFIAIAAGGSHSAALRNDGTVVGFGNNYPYGQATPPAGLNNVVAIAAGMDHSLALRSDGTLAAWGDNYYGQSSIPFGLNNVVAISAGHFHNLALKRDGTIVVWGDNSGGQAVAPAGLSNVVAVSGGNFHSLVLLENPDVPIPPAFVWQPTDRTVVKDQTTLFKPQLSGSLPMRFQWYFNGTPLTSQTNGWLLLNTLQTNQSGGYQLVAMNNYGSATSSVATLNVLLVPPSFTQQPQSADRPVNSGVTFSTAVAGSTPLSYQWFYNGAVLAGQTSTALQLSNLQTNQAGSYWLVASNLAGVATSSVAALTVGYPPGIVVAPTNPAVALTSNLVLSVVVSGSEPLSYQWRRNFGGLTDDARIHGATSNVLTIQQIGTNDLGNYDVIVSSPYGLLSTPLVSLTILYPPTIAVDPVSRSVPAGTNVAFTVTPSGTAPFTYQWRFNSADLPAKTNVALTLVNVQATNNGGYSVVVSNPYGVATSGVATLTVLPAAPIITTQAVSRVASVGQTVNFIVVVKGSEPMTCQWQKNGSDLPGANSFSLALNNVNSTHAGTYRAAVSNEFGFAFSTNVTLVVSPVLVWPTNNQQISGNITIPASATNVIAIAAAKVTDAGRPCFALRADGTLVNWGGFTSIPANATNVVAISIGGPGLRAGENNLALLGNGTVVHWSPGIAPIPAAITNGNIVAVAAGAQHQMVLRSDGTVFAWGSAASSVTNVPPNVTNVVAIAAARDFSMALRADGTAVVWGPKATSQAAAFSNFVNISAISAGGDQGLGLLQSGTALGYVVTNNGPQTLFYGPPPASATNLTAISAGLNHSLALRADRTVLGWGNTNFGQTTIPVIATNVLAIAAGSQHSLALVADPFAPPIPPRIARAPLGRALKPGDNVVFNALAIGGLPLNVQWLRNGAPLSGQTNQWLALTSASPGDAGDYQLVATNDFGAVTSVVAVVTVGIPQPALKFPARNGNTFSFTLNTVAGVYYASEFGNDSLTGTWTEFDHRIGTGGAEVIVDTNTLPQTRLYRVQAIYPPPAP